MRFKPNTELKRRDSLGMEMNAVISSISNDCNSCIRSECSECEREKSFVVYDFIDILNYALSGKELNSKYCVVKKVTDCYKPKTSIFGIDLFDFMMSDKYYPNISNFQRNDFTIKKESTMNKIIEEVYADDKTSDAVLVNKHFGGEIETSFLYKLQVTQFKKELLEEAKRREEELKKK